MASMLAFMRLMLSILTKMDHDYRIIDSAAKVDMVGGYRLVNFAVNTEKDENKTAADISLSGPFLGITVTY